LLRSALRNRRLLLGHGVGDVVLGADFHDDDRLVQVDTLSSFGERSEDVPVGRLNGVSGNHREHARVVDEHWGRWQVRKIPPLQGSLKPTKPGDRPGRVVEPIGSAVCAVFPGRAVERVELAVVDAGVHASHW
jgi:hypothetical protein